MKKVLVFGHKNPDTDSICSAIAYAALKSKLNVQAEPVRLGEINEETQYALNFFKVDPPRYVENVASEADEVILVDHNERQQSADDIENVRIIEVIDHHRIANFQTSDPLYYRAEPVGCTATILYKLYQENKIEIPKEIAGLMLSAIVSDSLLFKSPTCTEEDIVVANKLAEIAEVNRDEYGLNMLKAGANVSESSVEDLVASDSKEFSIGDHLIEIAQINVVDLDEVFTKKEELEIAINDVISTKNLDLFLLVVTDILNNDSKILALGEIAKKVNEAFNIELIDNVALLEGVVSRKKQIVPPLTDSLS